MDGSDAKNESSVMNANELADELNRKLSGRLIGFTADMLRQQQSEIEALKEELKKSAEVNRLLAEDIGYEE